MGDRRWRGVNHWSKRFPGTRQAERLSEPWLLEREVVPGLEEAPEFVRWIAELGTASSQEKLSN